MSVKSLRDHCPHFTEADNTVLQCTEKLAIASDERAAKHGEADRLRALVASPERAAAEGVDAASIHSLLREAESAEYAANVAFNSAKIDLDAALAERRRCADGAAEKLGAAARKRLLEIQARYDRAKAEMEEASTAELALIQEVNDHLRPAYSNERTASHYGIQLRPAVG